MNKVRITGQRAILGISLTVGLALWFARGSADCKQAAQPVIDALARYRRAHGHYPHALDALVREKFLQSVPRPTSNLGILHSGRFEYWAEPDPSLDYYCLGYAEQPLLATHWKGIFYVSFRRAWDDAPGVPRCDLFMIPIERAGDLFQRSRSSTDLRRLVAMFMHQQKDNPWPVYHEDVIQAAGKVFPCATDSGAGFCVEAEDAEAAAFRFISNPAPAELSSKHEVIRILEREREGTRVRWREVFRAS